MSAGRQFSGDENYELLEQLGEGGEGVVYRARHRMRGELVALKTIPVTTPERVLRFKREFRELRELRHPNIVRLHELTEGDGHWYYTMELVNGQDVLSYVRPDSILDPNKLRHALGSLVDAVRAIHDRGLVHRDLSPQNVLVTADGRVVLIDLGVSLRSVGTSGEEVIGTAAYMAPEQAMGKPLSGKADWYSVGVVLYEALFGQLPFRGAPLQLLQAKQLHMPEFPEVRNVLAAPLARLCERMLQTSPDDRADTDEILAALGKQAERAEAAPDAKVSAHVDQLYGALVEARAGQPRVVIIHGPGGSGKTSLLQEFCERVQGAVVFRGTCSADESLLFRALDGAVDAIVDYLAGLPTVLANHVVPVRSGPLVRAFPTLGRITAAVRHVRSDASNDDDAEGLAHALAELVAGIAEREGCVVLALDDLHNSDADGLALITRLLAHSSSTRLLIVASERVSEDPREWLEELHRTAELTDARIDHVVLEHAADAAHAAPALTAIEPAPARSADSMSDRGWQLLCTIALAETEVSRPRLARALGWELQELAETERELTDLAAIEAVGADGASKLALANKAERGALVASLSSALAQRLNRGLGRAFSDVPAAHQRAGRHLEAGGEPGRAAKHYVHAADKAASALACGRAVHLYDRALPLLSDSDTRRVGLLAKSADALVASGRLAEGAERYAAGAQVSLDAIEAMELTRCAADCYLRSGHVDKGIVAHRRAFAAMGISLPGSTKAAFRSLLWHRVRVRLGGLRYKIKPTHAVPVNVAMHIDSLLAASLEFAMIDFLRGGDLHARALLQALKVGDEHRITRALITEAAYQGGSGDHARCDVALAKAAVLVDKLGEPYLRGYHTAVRGIITVMRGEFPAGLDLCRDAIQTLNNECSGTEWEVATTEHFTRWAMFYMGEFESLGRHVLAQLRVAEERGDLFSASLLRTGYSTMVWLARDQPNVAESQCDYVEEHWTQHGFLTTDWWLLFSRVNIDLYRGHAAKAWGRIERAWPVMKANMLLRAEGRRIEAIYMRGRCALAMLMTTEDSSRWRREVERMTRNLEKEKLDWAHGLAHLLRAARANIDTDKAVAIEEAANAAQIFRDSGATLFETIADAISFEHDRNVAPGEFIAQNTRGVRRPIALASMLAPGFSANVEWTNETDHEAVPIVRVVLTGHFTVAAFQERAAEIEAEIAQQGPSSVVVDTTALRGHDPESRLAFVNWYRANREGIRRLAIVADRMDWRIGTRTMALLSSGEIKPFSRVDEAMAWAAMTDA